MFAWILLSLAQAQNVLEVPDTYENLGLAVEAAADGDIIEVDGSTDYARITNNDIVITKSVTIRGVSTRPELPRIYVLDADVVVEFARLRGVDRLFANLGTDVGAVVATGSLTLDDVILASGNGNATGVASLGGELILVEVQGNNFFEQAPVVALGGYLEVDTSSFSNNFNGAIQTYDTDVVIRDSDFGFNWSDIGGADLDANNVLAGHYVQVEDTTFDFSTGNDGGSISVDNASLTVDRSDFIDAYSFGSGGAILVNGHADNPIDVWIGETTFDRPIATNEGGALELATINAAEIDTSTFVVPHANVNGGAVVIEQGALTVTNSDFDRGNTLWGNAGAIWARNGDGDTTGLPGTTLHLIDTTFQGFVNGDTNAFAAGCIWGDQGTTLIVEGGSFDHCAAAFNGGAIAFQGLELSVTGTKFKSNTASLGAAVWASSSELTITGAEFDSNAGDFGPAILADASTLQLDDTLFVQNVAASSSVVELPNSTSVILRRNRFCGNVAASSGSIAYVTSNANSQGSFLATNNVWLANSSDLGSALFYAPADWLFNTGPPIAIRNNDFVLDEVGAGASVRGTVEFTNNIVGGQAVGLLLEEHFGNALSGTNNLWYDNAVDTQGTAGALPHGTAVRGQDPMFQGLVAGDCASNLWLQAESPARDAGSPGILDPDGTVSDIGAFGGPNADLVDLDQDGVFEDLDCDDTDPAIHPGIPEIPYDGIDNDCDGMDLCDGDGDGFTAVECGGKDCDDTNPDVHPLAVDRPNDGIDNDCDDFEPSTWIGGASCACDSGSGGLPMLAWIAALGFAAFRRRED